MCVLCERGIGEKGMPSDISKYVSGEPDTASCRNGICANVVKLADLSSGAAKVTCLFDPLVVDDIMIFACTPHYE